MLAVLCSSTMTPAQSTDEFFAAPKTVDVRFRVLEWVAAQKVQDESVRGEVARIWGPGAEGIDNRTLLDSTAETFAIVDPATRQVVEASAPAAASKSPTELSSLIGEGADPFYAANLKLYVARSLAQKRLYDESLELLSGIDPHVVVDPPAYFFYKAVCQQQLLQRDEALASLTQLLERTEKVPAAYSSVAELMKHELDAFEKKSLDEVSRLMQDSERRLDLGRANQKVQKVQDDIIALLDDIIKDLEQQASGGGGGGSSSSGGSNSNQSAQPAGDSVVKGQTAPGAVEHKDLKQQGGWGALPPKEETKAKNLINREFPAHYGRAVEEYFRKLANRPAGSAP